MEHVKKTFNRLVATAGVQNKWCKELSARSKYPLLSVHKFRPTQGFYSSRLSFNEPYQLKGTYMGVELDLYSSTDSAILRVRPYVHTPWGEQSPTKHFHIPLETGFEIHAPALLLDKVPGLFEEVTLMRKNLAGWLRGRSIDLAERFQGMLQRANELLVKELAQVQETESFESLIDAVLQFEGRLLDLDAYDIRRKIQRLKQVTKEDLYEAD